MQQCARDRYEDIDYAIDRQQVGMQKNTGMKFPNRQKLVACAGAAGQTTVGRVSQKR